MKVTKLKDWNAEKLEIGECTCYTCETSHDEIKVSDLMFGISVDSFTEIERPYFYVICRVCSCEIGIDCRSIPKYVQKLVKARDLR